MLLFDRYLKYQGFALDPMEDVTLYWNLPVTLREQNEGDIPSAALTRIHFQ